MAKSPLLTESARDLILNHLKDNLNATLEEMDNQYNDGINLEPIETGSFYFSEAFLTLNPPAVYVLGGDMDVDNASAPNYLSANVIFTVAISSQDIGADRLDSKARRYSRCLYQLLNQQDLVSSDGRLKLHLVTDAIRFSDTGPTKALPDAAKIYRKDCFLQVTAKHFEGNLIA